MVVIYNKRVADKNVTEKAHIFCSLPECFYRGNVFQTMTLPDEVESTTTGFFVNDLYSSEVYVF